jgi:hypothetical protein
MRNDAEEKPKRSCDERAENQIMAPMRSEQRNVVDKKTGQRLHVPGQRTDAEQDCHLRLGSMQLILEQVTYR